ncbi:hypothetical protein [Thermococcus waiotapuensis]|uniref:Tetratricopeptide repeat protein n=1 Tax=Thermococcus waiotapuensis TaxID=90909 RepID=A0AAE4NUK9_9EURY|nr:hypothetical protein [Thermococcus waiotapuensis]MDV3103113.1 hypothetical protein [Thermococcus waiotapuensis]
MSKLAILPDLASPEDLEGIGFKKLQEGEIKEGLKLILQAAKKYEEEKKLEDAARLYQYSGYFSLEKLKKPDIAKKPLLKSASLYIELIERELEKLEVDTDRLGEYISKTLSIFATIRDEKNLKKYAKYFAEIYEDLANTYRENENISLAIKTYEDAFRYYKLLEDEESIKRIADILITIYGELAEKTLQDGKIGKAAEAFYRVATYVLELFDYGSQYIEMMDTAAKNYEKASKIAYSQGDLDETTSYLLEAQYAYLLAGNANRAKLIGLNNTRMLYQVITSHQKEGDERKAGEKFLELSQALLLIGKTEEAFKAYREALSRIGDLKTKALMRAAILKVYGAEKKDKNVLLVAEEANYYIERGDASRAITLLNSVLLNTEELRPVVELLHEAEGLSRPTH